MATYTTNLNLKKPTTSEMYNVLDWNDNSDKIDTAVGNLNSQKVSYSYDTAGTPVSADTLDEGMFFGVLTQATSPDGTANYWFVITMPRATGIQIVFAIGGTKIYVRPRTSNTWGAWKVYTGS